MPLVRFEVRNEYRLGDPELYRASSAVRAKDGDSKALLDGVAVAGLVGILRQLGDLAEFAADVFHDLHEQVTATAARRRKVLSRIQNIETALPLVEKAIKEQKSHIHFAYVGGSDWHAHIRDNQSLVSTELPRYMMDSYEECHDPPRLYLLDKFDHGGNGACLRRYSDPSYFRRVWTLSESEKTENTPRKKNTRSLKRKGSRLRVREFQHGAYQMSLQDSRTTNSYSRSRFGSPSMDGQNSENSLSEEIRSNVEPLFQSTKFDAKAKESYGQQASGVDSELPADEYLELSDSISQQQGDVTLASHTHIERSEDGDDDILDDSAPEQSVPRSSSVTCDEKTEIVVPLVPLSHNGILFSSVLDSAALPLNYELPNMESSRNEVSKDADILFDTGKVPISLGMSQFDDATSDTDNFMDALNTTESETETEAEDLKKLRAKPSVFSHVSEPQTESKKDEAIPNESIQYSPQIESPEASHLTVDEEVVPRVPNLASESAGCMQQPVSVAQSQEFAIADGAFEFYIHDRPETKDLHECDTVHPQPYRPDSQVTVKNESAVEKSELGNSSLCTAGLPTVQLWTNGILFGVEPSKPPDLGLLNASNEKIAGDLRNSASKLSSSIVNTRTIVNNTEEDKSSATITCDANSSNNLESTNKNSSSGSQLSLSTHDVLQNESSQYSPLHETHIDGTYLKQGFPLLRQPLSSDGYQKKQETSSVNGPPPSTTYCSVDLNGSSQSISSAFSDLAYKFLANTLQQKTLLTANFTSESSSTTNGNKKIEEIIDKDHHMPRSADSAETGRQNIDANPAARSSHHSIFSSSHSSGQSSPPLEHMKISFHPINGVETSRTKQNMSCVSAHESIDDYLFPSYQLLRGPTNTIQDYFHESDDDTFCNSSPYSSDEPLSPGSYSNSDLWEQDERYEHNNHDICETLSMDSAKMDYLTSSLSCELQYVDAEGHKVPVVCESSASDLPNLDSILSERNQQEGTCDLPHDPPPPPLQWRILKPSIVSPIDDDVNAVDNVSNLDHLQAPELPSEQQEDYAKVLNIVEKNELKVNGEVPNHVVDNRKDYTREELLSEIKAKSFNLRKTVTSKSRLLPISTTNVANANVTAMLEKATAIRQAFVSSDETGDHENWSDE